MKKFIDLGYNIRYYHTSQFSMFVKDREESFLVVRNPKDMKDRISIHFRDEAISGTLADYFYVVWKKAKPIKF